MHKKSFKEIAGKCAICEESNYSVLDVHRIVAGQEYSIGNCVTLCANCHRLHHSNHINIKEKRYSTIGWILIYEKDNQEIIKEL